MQTNSPSGRIQQDAQGNDLLMQNNNNHSAPSDIQMSNSNLSIDEHRHHSQSIEGFREESLMAMRIVSTNSEISEEGDEMNRQFENIPQLGGNSEYSSTIPQQPLLSDPASDVSSSPSILPSGASRNQIFLPTTSTKNSYNNNNNNSTSNNNSDSNRGLINVHQPSSTSSSIVSSRGLRRGKWTEEEDNYAMRIIEEFKAGLLPLLDGTTLRTFLSKLLNCDPMRISKKFVGINCIGKQVFRRQQGDADISPSEIERRRTELAELESRFLAKLSENSPSVKQNYEHQQQQSNGSQLKGSNSRSPRNSHVKQESEIKIHKGLVNNVPIISAEIDHPNHWSASFGQPDYNPSSSSTNYAMATKPDSSKIRSTIPNLATLSIPYSQVQLQQQSAPTQSSHKQQYPPPLLAPTFSAKSDKEMFDQLQFHQRKNQVPVLMSTINNQSEEEQRNQMRRYIELQSTPLSSSCSSSNQNQHHQIFLNYHTQTNDERDNMPRSNLLQYRTRSNEETGDGGKLPSPLPLLLSRTQSNEESSTLSQNPFYSYSLANERKRLSIDNLQSYSEMDENDESSLGNDNAPREQERFRPKRRATTNNFNKTPTTEQLDRNILQQNNMHEPTSSPPSCAPVSLAGFENDDMGTRNGSVEDFLSLVENGTIPLPEEPESPINGIFNNQGRRSHQEMSPQISTQEGALTLTQEETMLQQLRLKQHGPPMGAAPSSTQEEAMLQQLRQKQHGPPMGAAPSSTQEEAMLQQLRQKQHGPSMGAAPSSTQEEAMLQQLRKKQHGPPMGAAPSSTQEEAMLQQLRQKQHGPPMGGPSQSL